LRARAQLFLDSFMELGLPPAPRAVDMGGATADFENGAIAADASVIDPTHTEFSGFVFKLQANLDPKHRDRMAFVRASRLPPCAYDLGAFRLKPPPPLTAACAHRRLRPRRRRCACAPERSRPACA
jgi:hypothetical protein